MNKLILNNREFELEEIFEFDTMRNMFNKSYDFKFYDVEEGIIRRFKIKAASSSKEDLCRCGHDKAFHFNDLIKEERCIYGIRIGENGIIDNGCNCEKFRPSTFHERSQENEQARKEIATPDSISKDMTSNALKSTSNKRDDSSPDNIHQDIKKEIDKDYNKAKKDLMKSIDKIGRVLK